MQIVNLTCDRCGKPFERKLKEVKRQFKQGIKRVFCSRSCAAFSNAYRGPGNPQNLVAHNKRDEFTPFRRFLSRACSRDAGCNLSLEYLKELWERQQGKCALTNIVLALKHGANSDPCVQASLDRIDSTVGYVTGNVQFVALPINLAKNHFSDSQVKNFLDLVRAVNV